MSRPKTEADDRHNENRRKGELRPGSYYVTHHSVSNHPKTRAIYDDNDLYATWHRIQQLASEKGAAQTDDWLVFSRADIHAVTRAKDWRTAVTRWERVCSLQVRTVEELWRDDVKTGERLRDGYRVHVRNFARKQGLTPRRQRAEAAYPAASPSPSSTASPNTPLAPLRAAASDPEFEQVWEHYPKRAGTNPKRAALHAWTARRKAGASVEDLRAGVDRYARYLEATGKLGTQYVLRASTFFGPDDPWKGEYPIPAGNNGNGGAKTSGPPRWVLSDGTIRAIPGRVQIVETAGALPYYETPSGLVMLARGARRIP